MTERLLPQNKKMWKIMVACTFVGLSACQTSGTYNKVNQYSVDGTSTVDNKASSAKIRTQMAAQYISENKLDAAKRHLERALATDRRYAPAYDMMGVLLQREGSRINLIKAEDYFKQAIEIDPEFMQAHNNYGVYLSQLGRYYDAIEQFKIAGSALGYEGRIGALENLGRTALKVDDMPLASQAFVKVLENDRQNIVAHIELVDILIDNDRIGQAQNLYNEMVALVGHDANKIPRILLQGIRLAHAQNNTSHQEKLSRQLLADFPLSEEAKKLRVWIRNPEASWK